MFSRVARALSRCLGHRKQSIFGKLIHASIERIANKRAIIAAHPDGDASREYPNQNFFVRRRVAVN
jgi:hypothetical protein